MNIEDFMEIRFKEIMEQTKKAGAKGENQVPFLLGCLESMKWEVCMNEANAINLITHLKEKAISEKIGEMKKKEKRKGI